MQIIFELADRVKPKFKPQVDPLSQTNGQEREGVSAAKVHDFV